MLTLATGVHPGEPGGPIAAGVDTQGLRRSCQQQVRTEEDPDVLLGNRYKYDVMQSHLSDRQSPKRPCAGHARGEIKPFPNW